MKSGDPDRPRATASGARRLALTGAAAAAAVVVWMAFPWLERTLFVADFEFTALEEPAGFRRISGGEFSGGWDPLAGVLGASGALALGGEDFCRAIFGAAPLGANVVPIAYFSDYRCAYCRACFFAAIWRSMSVNARSCSRSTPSSADSPDS